MAIDRKAVIARIDERLAWLKPQWEAATQQKAEFGRTYQELNSLAAFILHDIPNLPEPPAPAALYRLEIPLTTEKSLNLTVYTDTGSVGARDWMISQAHAAFVNNEIEAQEFAQAVNVIMEKWAQVMWPNSQPLAFYAVVGPD